MANLASDKVTVFPSAQRANGTSSTEYTYARMTSEGNLTNLIYSLISPYTGNDGFVISEDNKVIEFIIKGYYFKADLSDYTPTGSEIWASINIENLGTLSDYPELKGKDESDEYTGLQITASRNTASGYYNLHLFNVNGGTWTVPDASYIRVAFKNIDFSDVTKIDGKI